VARGAIRLQDGTPPYDTGPGERPYGAVREIHADPRRRRFARPHALPEHHRGSPSPTTTFHTLGWTRRRPDHDILQAIVTYLYDNYDVFTSFPARPGAGQDMVEWFLSRPKTTYPNASGTPYDFATAFTMLARAFDILPAWRRRTTTWSTTAS